MGRLPRRNGAWALRLGLFLATALLVCLAAAAPVSVGPRAFAQSDLPTSFEPIQDPTPSETPGEAGGEEETIEADPIPTVDVDVVVYATQTSGLAAARELALGAPQLRVALVSCGNLLETPLTQGLSVEDARDIENVSGGFYTEWRETVMRYYALMGKKASNGTGRFVYEPEVAATVLWSYVTGSKAPNVQFYSAKLLDASDGEGQRYVDIQVEGTGPTRLNTKYFIDASVEGDLARMLGASYRIGRDEEVYNDVFGTKPAYPSSANNYVTAPQRFSALLTLQVYSSGTAPRVADLVHPNYNPGSYLGTTFAWKNVTSFGSSWSMKIAVLPNNKRELNETWSDWPDIGLSFQWVFEPERRGEIRKRVLEWSINRVRYLQENGYWRVGIATIPQKLYVREGPRIVGRDTYTASDLRAGAVRDTVALGCYVEYDRHDAFYPTHIETTRYVRMPMEALMVAGHSALLVSTAVSTDYAAYSSAVRMEPTRANFGAAAAMIVIAAAQAGVDPSDVSYDAVRTLLYNRGYRVE
ncbi:MAG: hypothetical protein A2133_04395 [Actinobacteria bacterium RBG_16_64_13]|nr:MAG: hypothetical protein A2133_04395 [Actinobacteria bacterium RBG_16_64_13]